MLVIMVRIGDKLMPGKRFEDNGVGKEAAEKNALYEFESEADMAQYSANFLGQPIQVELLDTHTGQIKASKRLTPNYRIH